mmetsp:Transcript_38814/g.82481  ORF Transcript_38814/g.82481 Transcript_38814/m.82481 type:complete len:218 (+) Transcript_38814:1528-2181(+)
MPSSFSQSGTRQSVGSHVFEPFPRNSASTWQLPVLVSRLRRWSWNGVHPVPTTSHLSCGFPGPSAPPSPRQRRADLRGRPGCLGACGPLPPPLRRAPEPVGAVCCCWCCCCCCFAASLPLCCYCCCSAASPPVCCCCSVPSLNFVRPSYLVGCCCSALSPNFVRARIVGVDLQDFASVGFFVRWKMGLGERGLMSLRSLSYRFGGLLHNRSGCRRRL